MQRDDKRSAQDRIRREIAMAEELGLSVQLPVSLEANFAAEGNVRMPEPSDLARRGVSDGLTQRARGAIPRRDNRLVDLPDAAASISAAEACLGIMNDANRPSIVPFLLSTFGDAAAQVDDIGEHRDLHDRVLRAAFGEQFFRKSREARISRRKPRATKRTG